MRYLKRFRNWLTNGYYSWALFQQLGISDSYRDERVAEQTKGHQAAADVTLAEAVPTVATQTSQRLQAIRSSLTSEPPRAEAARPIQPDALLIPEKLLRNEVGPIAELKEAITPATEVATVLRKPIANEHFTISESKARAPQTVPADLKPQVAEAKVTDETGVPTIAEPKHIVTPTKSVVTVPRKTVVAEPCVLEKQVPQADTKCQGAGDNAPTDISARGKYDPGTIDDQTAQRLARLLISEIKLYNVNKIEGAGEVHNIYDLLKSPIDRSRQHYRHRLGEAIKTMPDYFKVELIRSLCAGDPSRLGPNYPAS